MKDINGTIKFRDQEYTLIFNLNVMERIQEKYGSLDAWGQLTDGATGEPNVQALIFGFTCMINEGIDIENEIHRTSNPPLTPKQVGRILTEVGLTESSALLNDTVINSTQSVEKNA